MTDLESKARAIYKEYYSDAPGKRSRTLVSIITAALQQARRDALVEARGEVATGPVPGGNWNDKGRQGFAIARSGALAILDRRIAGCAADEDPAHD